MKGSFTVEASLNISCVLICLIIFIYMGLYLHDKVVLECAAFCAAQRGRLYVTENLNLQNADSDWERFQRKGLLWRLFDEADCAEIEVYAERMVQDRLTVCSPPKFRVSAKADQVTVSYQAETLLKGISLMGNGGIIPVISGSVTDTGMEAEEFLRLVKAIMEEK